MILKDVHKDLERYLNEDCYCPGEIYDCTGFFFQVFKAEEECKELYRNDEVIAVVCRDQILVFWVKDAAVMSADRCDATDNNIRVIPKILSNTYVKGVDVLDEFEPGSTKKAFDEIMGVADAIMLR